MSAVAESLRVTRSMGGRAWLRSRLFPITPVRGRYSLSVVSIGIGTVTTKMRGMPSCVPINARPQHSVLGDTLQRLKNGNSAIHAKREQHALGAAIGAPPAGSTTATGLFLTLATWQLPS